MYNMLFGRNPLAELLLAMLGYTPADVGRFRDCFPNGDGTEIHIFTRNGGGNREEYSDVFAALSTHPNYLGDADDSYDCTYAIIRFSVPEKYREIVKEIADKIDTTPPAEKFQLLMKNLNEGKDNAVTSRAKEIGEKLFGFIKEGKSGDVTTPDGSVSIIAFDPTKEK